jgi:hypothetical protein
MDGCWMGGSCGSRQQGIELTAFTLIYVVKRVEGVFCMTSVIGSS